MADVSGWAIDVDHQTAARSVLLVNDGKVIASTTPSDARLDAANGMPAATASGFRISTPVPAGAKPSVYQVTEDGKAHCWADRRRRQSVLGGASRWPGRGDGSVQRRERRTVRTSTQP